MHRERSFLELLSFHSDLRRSIRRTRHLLAAGRHEDAIEEFAGIRPAVRRRLIEEHQVLLPLYVERSAPDAGPAESLLVGGIELLALVRDLDELLERLHPVARGAGLGEALAGFDTLDETLEAHAARCRILYLALDRSTAPAERSALLARCAIRLGWPPDEVLGQSLPA